MGCCRSGWRVVLVGGGIWQHHLGPKSQAPIIHESGRWRIIRQGRNCRKWTPADHSELAPFVVQHGTVRGSTGRFEPIPTRTTDMFGALLSSHSASRCARPGRARPYRRSKHCPRSCRGSRLACCRYPARAGAPGGAACGRARCRQRHIGAHRLPAGARWAVLPDRVAQSESGQNNHPPHLDAGYGGRVPAVGN